MEQKMTRRYLAGHSDLRDIWYSIASQINRFRLFAEAAVPGYETNADCQVSVLSVEEQVNTHKVYSAGLDEIRRSFLWNILEKPVVNCEIMLD